MERKRILTFGNIVMDCIMSVPFLPGHDEKVFASSAMMSPGGPAVHFALAMKGLGREAGVAGWVGKDPLGNRIREDLASKGVTPQLSSLVDVATPLAVVLVDPSGEKSVVLSPQANLPEPSQASPLVGWDFSNTLHVHTHLFFPEHVEHLLRACRKHGVSCSLDVEPSSVRRWGKEKVDEVLGLTDVLFINESALAILCPGGGDLTDSLAQLSQRGPSVIVCTRGRNGSAALFTGNTFFCRALQVTTRNSLAAGDIFAASFIHRFLEFRDLPSALRFATVASALAVSRSHENIHYPSLTEIEVYLLDRVDDFFCAEVNK